jgi:hypothetical protein
MGSARLVGDGEEVHMLHESGERPCPGGGGVLCDVGAQVGVEPPASPVGCLALGGLLSDLLVVGYGDRIDGAADRDAGTLVELADRGG